MTSKKPETPEEEWAALRAAAIRTAEDELDRQTDEEVRASLAADGLDVAKMAKDGDAFIAGLQAELTKMAADGEVEPAAKAPVAAVPVNPPSNVVPFARARSRRATWTVTLLAAALAAALAVTTAITIARRDPAPPPRPNAPPPEVLVDVHAKEIADLRAKAEAAVATQDWKGCLVKLGAADALVAIPDTDADAAVPPRAPDPLRKRCADGRIAELHRQAVAAYAHQDWRMCVLSLDEARAIRPDAAEGPPNFDAGASRHGKTRPMTLGEVCNQAYSAVLNSKGPH